MTFGDIIEKILGVFGVPPARERKLKKQIAAITEKIAEMEERRRGIMRTNEALAEKIADLKRQLQVETNPHNQDMLMDQIDELEKEAGRKQALAQQMAENITAQRAIRAKQEQLLEDSNRTDSVEIDMLVESVEDMNELREEAVKKVDSLDAVGRKPRSSKAAAKEDAARAARRAAMLGTAAAAPAAPPAKKEPAPKAPSAAPAPAPKAESSASPAGEGKVAVG